MENNKGLKDQFANRTSVAMQITLDSIVSDFNSKMDTLLDVASKHVVDAKSKCVCEKNNWLAIEEGSELPKCGEYVLAINKNENKKTLAFYNGDFFSTIIPNDISIFTHWAPIPWPEV